MFTADGAANAEYFFVEFLGHQPHPLHIVGVVQVEEGLDVQLPMAGMTKQRCRDLPPFEHILRSHEEIGEDIGRDRHVLDHGHRAAGALEPIQERHGPIGQVEEQLRLLLVEGLAAAKGQPGLLLDAFDQTSHLVAHVLRLIALELDEHGRFGLGGNQQIEADLALPHQAQMATIHQVASSRAPGKDQRQRAGGLVQAFIQQQNHASMPGHGLSGQRGLGNQAQSALGTHHHARQIDGILTHNVGQVVSATLQRAAWLLAADDVARGDQNRRKAVDKLPLARVAVDAGPGNERLAAQFQYLPVSRHYLEALHVPPHGAVLQPSRTRGVDSDHAADRGDRRIGRIGPKNAPPWPQMGVQPLVHDSRLHADRLRLDADHPPQVLGKVDHQPWPKRFAGHAAAGAAGVQGDAFFGRVLHASRNIGGRSRTHHAQRPDFINAAVAGEELAEEVVAPHVARNQPAEVLLNSLALVIEFVHGMPGWKLAALPAVSVDQGHQFGSRR